MSYGPGLRSCVNCHAHFVAISIGVLARRNLPGEASGVGVAHDLRDMKMRAGG